MPPGPVSGYRSPFADPRRRGAVIGGLAALHVAAWMLLTWYSVGLSVQAGGHGRSGAGPQNVFAIRAPTDEVGAPRTGGGQPAATVPTVQARAQAVHKGAGELDESGDAGLGDELAGALADDPFAGGGISSYEVILRLHIASHSRGLRERLQRPGLAMLRFRVARDGSVIDARVLGSPTGKLGELALAALWRSEPLPRVPDELTAPLEVDVPIDFRVRG